MCSGEKSHVDWALPMFEGEEWVGWGSRWGKVTISRLEVMLKVI